MNTAIDTTDWRPVDKFKFFIYDGPRLVAGFHSREERDFILRAAKSFKAALFALQYVRGV